jgi:hypothetical protein
MNPTISSRGDPELKQRWRQQVASQLRRRAAQGPRQLAAVTCLFDERSRSDLVDIRHLRFIVLYDRRQIRNTLAIRCASYSAARVPWGVSIGGAAACRFDKDLALAPTVDGRGGRFNIANHGLLSQVLDLDQLLERHSRYPHLPRRSRLRWPKLWAGFQPADARSIEPAGPEFESMPHRGIASDIASWPRTADCLTLFPLEFVSHAWQQIRTIFADLTTIPKRQVVSLDSNVRNLRGYEGAIEFDLLSSRFNRVASSRSPRRRQPMTAISARAIAREFICRQGFPADSRHPSRQRVVCFSLRASSCDCSSAGSRPCDEGC